MLHFESDEFRHPNLLEFEFKSSTIQFGTPLHLSLATRVGQTLQEMDVGEFKSRRSINQQH